MRHETLKVYNHVFHLLAKNPTEENKKIALELYFSFTKDCSFDEIDCLYMFDLFKLNVYKTDDATEEKMYLRWIDLLEKYFLLKTNI